ncbi:EH signature domain-containing protein [Rhizobium sp. 18065]|uniref:EH signature domain-containing protein n=1 Tax=Rhizobium sp. 18065 TaxID=2681411 RepID=UPI00135B4EDA|nr:EH signature domain-containing protein [Rhizobium sp. 18065]
MTLIEALRERPRVRTSDFRNTDELDAAAAAIQAAFPGYDKTPNLALDQIIDLLRTSVSNWEWNAVKVGDVALAIRAAYTSDAGVPVEVEKFLQREILATTSTAILQASCEVYMNAWVRGSPSSISLAHSIRDRSEHLPGSWAKCFKAMPELLDAEHAPEVVAARLVDKSDAFDWLTAAGVVAPHSGKLMRQVHYAWLHALPEASSVEVIQQIFAWVFPKQRPSLEGDLAASAVEKLLNPWLRSHPPADVRDILVHRIVEAFGDPRNQRAEFWALVTPAHRKVVVRWLAGESIDALLAIITKSTQTHMWPPRHVFWKGLYDKGFVEEAWVALSPAAIRNAAVMFEETKDPVYTMTGSQMAGGNRKDTCLLIMRIGRYTVVEGSHDYRIHVFESDDPAAPLFYQDTYDAEKIILPANHSDTRIHDGYGHWQRWVEQRLLR